VRASEAQSKLSHYRLVAILDDDFVGFRFDVRRDLGLHGVEVVLRPRHLEPRSAKWVEGVRHA
jgi:hypothetical protein